MAGKKQRKRKNQPDAWWTQPWVAGLFLVVLAVYLGFCLMEPCAPWWEWFDDGPLKGPLSDDNPGGKVGSVLTWSLTLVFGVVWAWALPVLLAVVGIAAVARRTEFLAPLLLRALPIWLVSVTWLAQPGWAWGTEESARLAGAAGFWTASAVHGLVGPLGGWLFISLALLVAVILVARPVLVPVLGWLAPLGGFVLRGLADLGAWLQGGFADLLESLKELASRRPQPRPQAKRRQVHVPETAAAGDSETSPDLLFDDEEEPEEREPRSIHWPEEPEADDEPAPTLVTAEPIAPADSDAPDDNEPTGLSASQAFTGPMEMPAVSLLAPPPPEVHELSTDELDAAADLLEATLSNFGVVGEVKDVRPGPVVTTYEYQPAAGVRVNQIVQRADDMALAMRARSLRMEAPIPGKAAVGIEIPNQQAQMVSLREVLQQEGGKDRKPLTVTLGKSVEGQPVSIDLAAQPHLLVAGSTGSGKSVCLNAMITNLLLYNDPSTLRLLLIDPKMLELNVYNGIPHLLMPVVTDPKEALRAMTWMVAQMDQRYRQLSKHSVRNIEQYNAKVASGEVLDQQGETVTEPMPYYVTIVDELADLMVQLGQDFEIPITRLAQKARAVGLHLVLATQRPSVDVLTGVIKANIPCRIAFRVIQRNDSRTILDTNGAEQLLGRGDMLYLMPGRAQPIRVHGAFVDVPECEAVAEHWRQYTGATEEVSLAAGGEGGLGVHSGEDEMFEDAVKVIVLHQSGSTSLLQRRLRIGYTRAGRLMDMMEEAGIVGPFTGSKARDVLVKPGDLPDLFGEDIDLE